MLLQLEKQVVDGKLPKTLFVQIDGGAENANKLVLAVLSYLLAKRVCGLEKIVLTRLPVGHTHEDIDGIFGRISRYIYMRHVITPQAYADAIKEALKGKLKIEPKVIDLYVIPDYESYFAGCIDKQFGCAYKGPHAKLQFIMEAVPREDKYPLGVKVTYRRFCSDLYPLLYPNKASPFGISLKLIETKVFPTTKPPVNVLLKFPPKGRVFVPDKFVGEEINIQSKKKAINFLSLSTRYFRFVETTYGGFPSIQSDLQKFKSEFPTVPNSVEWVKLRPDQFYIPFEEVFESDDPVISDYTISDMRTSAHKALLEGIEVEEDEDTLKRSAAIDNDGQRLLYKLKVPKVKDSGEPMPHFIDFKSRKYASAVGLRFFDTEDNTSHEIKSVIQGTDSRGKAGLQFVISDVEDDSAATNEKVSLVSCLKFIKDALAKKSIYRFDDQESAIKIISSFATVSKKAAASAGEMTANADNMTVAMLREELKQHGVNPTGLKAELLQKFKEVVANAASAAPLTAVRPTPRTSLKRSPPASSPPSSPASKTSEVPTKGPKKRSLNIPFPELASNP